MLNELVRHRGRKVEMRKGIRKSAGVGRIEWTDVDPMPAVPVEEVEDVRRNTLRRFRVRDEDDHCRSVQQMHGGSQRLQ